MPRPSGIAFLLAQLGAHVSDRFASRLDELDLTPAHVGVLRVVGQQPGLSQQALARELGALPSSVVRLIDELDERGLVERRRSSTDRRQHELFVPETAAGRIETVLAVVGAHDAEVTSSLTAAEKRTLLELLGKLAAGNDLRPGRHPAHGPRTARGKGPHPGGTPE